MSLDGGVSFLSLAFNKTRKINGIQMALCFRNGTPLFGTAYAAKSPATFTAFNTSEAWPKSQYSAWINDFSDSSVKQYCLWGKEKHNNPPKSNRVQYLAVGFTKASLPGNPTDAKWQAKRVSYAFRRHGGGLFEDYYYYSVYGLPYQGIDDDQKYTIFPLSSHMGLTHGGPGIPWATPWAYWASYMRVVAQKKQVTVLTCGQASGEKWYTASDQEITVDGVTIDHQFLKPEDETINTTDDEYPQWGIIADGSAVTAVADGTTLYSGRLGSVALFNSATIAQDPAFLNNADHAVVVNPKTFSQAIVLTAKTGLVSFTPGTSSYSKVMNAPGAKYCAYFNNLLILACTVELDWVEQEGPENEIAVTEYSSAAGSIDGIAYAGHEVVLSGQMADHDWVAPGTNVWFKGYGLPEAIDGAACQIKKVRNVDASHFGVILRMVVRDTIIETTGYTPNGVVMKMAVRSEKPYEQTVRSSSLSSFMDFSSDEDSDTSKAYQLFGSFTPITGLAVLNNMLYVFKRDTITEASYTGNANAPLSFEEDKYKFGGYNATTVRDKIFYYHPTKGICVFDGMREAIISEGMRSVFSSGEWYFVPYMDSAVAVVPAATYAKFFYVYDEGAWVRVDGGRIVPVFNASELEYLEITDSGVYYCSMPKTVRETGYNWRVNAYFPAGNTNAVFSPTPLAFSPGSYASGNIEIEAPEVFASIPLDTEKKDLAKRIRSITFDGMAGAATGQRTVTCRVESTHDRASNEPAAGDRAITDAFFDGKSECKVYPNVVGRDPFCVIRAQRQIPATIATDMSLYANWIDETSISAVNIDIESSGENPRR